MGFVSFSYLNSEDNFIVVSKFAKCSKEIPTRNTNMESSINGVKCQKHRVSKLSAIDIIENIKN